MKELNKVIEVFGNNHPITIAAQKYFEHHPSHSFGDDFDWWELDENGSVWTPPGAANPYIESELFFIGDSFYEIRWNNGEVEFICRDNILTFCGVKELSNIWNSILDKIGCDSPSELATYIEGYYRFDDNPLPILREKLKHLPITIQFGIVGGGHYWASARQATFVVRLDDETKKVELELVDYYVDESYQWWEIQQYEDIHMVPNNEHNEALYNAGTHNYRLRRFEKVLN